MNTKYKIIAICNFLSVILIISVTYIGDNGFNGNTVRGVSAKYYHLFTPSPYAFAIWGLIFLGLLIYTISQLVTAFKKNGDVEIIKRTGWWFNAANIFNFLWLFAWLTENIFLSLVIMIGILTSLLMVVIKTRLGLEKISISKKMVVYWPIGIYIGWISVALIANTAAFLVKIGWEPLLFDNKSWTIVMMMVAIILNLFLLIKRNMVTFNLVGVWALYAIYVRHMESQEILATTAIIGVSIISIGIFLFAVRNFYSYFKTSSTRNIS
ncbi:MAG: tryptophan-rich sensory protein [Bacteroidota bacterium]